MARQLLDRHQGHRWDGRGRLLGGLLAVGALSPLALAAPAALAGTAPAGAAPAGIAATASVRDAASPTSPAAATAAASRPVYRALGDSYAAGYALSGAAGCARSTKAYPVLLSRTTLRRDRLQFRACSGATTHQIAVHQLGQPAANRAVRVVTVSAGGNDVGFGAIATCSPNVVACRSAIDRGLALEASGAVRRNLVALLLAVHTAMPDAAVYALDYPIAIQHTRSQAGCDAQTRLAIDLFGAKLDQLNAGLNAAIHGAVGQIVAGNAHREHPIRLHEVRSVVAAFTGHGMCAPRNWIGRPDSTSPLHPTATGQAQLAKAVRRAL